MHRRRIEPSGTPVGYINAGGRGTRLNGLFTPDPETGIAKALLEIGDPKVKLIDHHIANLRQQNIENIVVAAGDQPSVYEYVHDVYAGDSNVRVTKSAGQLGTGGDLVSYTRRSNVKGPLLVQNVDTILDIDLGNFTHRFASQWHLGALAAIALTLNPGVPNEGAYVVGPDNRVIYSAEFAGDSEEPLFERANQYRASSTGAVMVDANLLRSRNWREQDGQLSLYRNCLRAAWEENGLYAYNNGHRFFRDVGTVAMWLDSQSDIELQSQLCYIEQVQTV